jgi:peptidyl-prolyl cis-trans isomerase B (cyclophilin B)
MIDPGDVVELGPPPRRRLPVPAGARMFLAGLAVGVLLTGTAWVAVDRFHSPAKPTAATSHATPSVVPAPAPSAGGCVWTPYQGPDEKSVGTPPASGEPRTGTAVMTLTTNLGVIEITIDRARTPCTAASFAYLAGKKFFDGSACHRLSTSGPYVLQCGDPTGTGHGGPGYRIPDENLPATVRINPSLLPTDLPSVFIIPEPGGSGLPPVVNCKDLSLPPEIKIPPGAHIECRGNLVPGLVPGGPRPVTYPRGTVSVANAGSGTGGSQFFIEYRDDTIDPTSTPFGKVTKGMEIVDKVAAGGVATGSANGDGPPKIRLEILSVTVS